MFEGDGFGVGLTVDRLGMGAGSGPELSPAGRRWRPMRLGELMPVDSRDDVGLGAELGRVGVADGQLWAYRLELIAELAVRRRDDRDRGPDQPGAAAPGWVRPSWVLEGYSEFLADEVAMIQDCSRGEATRLTEAALVLCHRMRDTWVALADGQLSWSRARAMAAEIIRHGPGLDPHALATVEAVVLAQAAELPVGRLRSLLRAELLKHDADAADRRRKQAEAAADVFLRRSVHDGMAEVVVVAPQPAAAAMVATADTHARQARADGDRRPLGLLRAEAMLHSVLRPWDDSRTPVTAELRILAPIRSLLADPADPLCAGDPTGIAEVEGEPVTAAHLRALLTGLDAVCPGGLQAPAGGTLHLDVLGSGGELLATLTRGELERAARRGCAAHPDGTCGCPVVGRPPATDAYRPTAAQRRFNKARDRQCRQPGCRNQVGWTDLDHVIAHADGGATDCDNLCCLCRRHHRLKTHAPGWRFRLDADGNLHVTTPTGVTRISRPPGLEWLEPFELDTLPAEQFDTLDPAPF
jgi:hypothetical protein